VSRTIVENDLKLKPYKKQKVWGLTEAQKAETVQKCRQLLAGVLVCWWWHHLFQREIIFAAGAPKLLSSNKMCLDSWYGLPSLRKASFPYFVSIMELDRPTLLHHARFTSPIYFNIPRTSMEKIIFAFNKILRHLINPRAFKSGKPKCARFFSQVRLTSLISGSQLNPLNYFAW
jgi:hypothetical protein